MSGMKLLALILGSVWFFPVSCMSSGVVGTWLVSHYDARDAREGDTLHNTFSFVTDSGDGTFAATRLVEARRSLEQFREIAPELKGASEAELWKAAGFDFLMPRPAGRRDIHDSNYTYRVLEQDRQGQLIEVVEAYHDGDNTIWSRYRATRDGITPLTSRMFYFGYAFAALPFAFGTALLFYGIGRLLRRRVQASSLARTE